MGAVKPADLLRARSRRPRALLAAAVTATLLLSGCGADRDFAVKVNGEAISQAELQEAAQQWNSFAQQAETPQTMISSLAKGAALEPFFADSPLTDASLASQFQQLDVAEPSDVLLDFARGRLFENSASSLDPAQVQAALADVDVEVNPRFGSWDPAAGAVVPSTPDWIIQEGADNAESTEAPGAGN